MPVELFIARPATGKTKQCIERVRDVLLSQPLSNVWVVVPDRLQAAAFRSRLAQSGGALSAHVGRFGDLYRGILESTGSYFPMASAPLLHTLIQETVEREAEEGNLAHYLSLRNMPGFFLELGDAFAELKRSLVFPDLFLEFAQSGTPSQQELARLYSRYQTRLRELGWADPEGLSWLAVETLEQKPDAATLIRLLVVDGFDSFTGAQHKALQLLASQVSELLITFPGEVDSQRVVHQRFAPSLERLTQDLSPKITSIPQAPFLPPDVLHLERSLFESSEKPIQSVKPKTVLLLEARSPAEEAREALRWFKARIIRDGVALSECAIFNPNPDTYNPFLRANAAEFGIPIRFSQSTALAASPAIAALFNLFSLPAQQFKTRLLFHALRSPYFEFGMDPSQVDVLEEISRKARIVEGVDQWKETWEQLIPTNIQSQSDLDDELILPGLPRGEDARLLRESLQKCFDHFVIPAQSQSQTQWVNWFEDLLDRLGFYRQAENERDATACEVLREILRALVLSESILGEHLMDYAGFVSSLQSALAGTGLPEPISKGQPALFVGKIVEARGIRFKSVALLGLSEGVFPEVECADPFMDESLRKTLGLEQRLNRQQIGLFYQAITRTDQYLLITRPYLSEDGEDWEASPFWKDVEKRLGPSAVKVVRPDDPQALNDSASSQELLFWAVRRKGLPVRFQELEPRWQALRQARDILRARRAKKPEGSHEGLMPFISKQMLERYAPGSVWSASRLEAYGTCPHQFYIGVALGLEPNSVPELGLDASQLGSLLHTILEETYRTAADPTDSASLLEALSKVSQNIFETAPLEYGFRPSALWEFEQEQLLNKLQSTIEALVSESEGWSPLAFEQKFGIGELPTLRVDLGGETILLRGVIDRLDRNEKNEIRVVDYKTGSSHLDAKDLKSGARLQLPLYALAARDTLKLGNVTEGFYWKILAAGAGGLKLSGFKTEKGQGVDEAINVVLEHLSRILRSIRAAEFPPIPPKGGCPTYCPAAQWCWRYEPGWGGAK